MVRSFPRFPRDSAIVQPTAGQDPTPESRALAPQHPPQLLPGSGVSTRLKVVSSSDEDPTPPRGAASGLDVSPSSQAEPLLRAAMAGDLVALGDLLQGERGRFGAIAARVVPKEVADAVQAANLDIIRGLHSFNPTFSSHGLLRDWRGWSARVALNAALRIKKGRRLELVEDHFFDALGDERVAPVDSALLHRELLESVVSELRRTDPHTLFMMELFNELGNWEAVAGYLDIPAATIRGAVCRARSRLQSHASFRGQFASTA